MNKNLYKAEILRQFKNTGIQLFDITIEDIQLYKHDNETLIHYNLKGGFYVIV